jgi:tetratricopeptide (TPR) repeat protein
MRIITRSVRSFAAVAVIIGITAGTVPVSAQGDLIPVADITGGSSVFVFKGGSKAAPKKFSTRTASTRTQAQRAETTRKVSRQYVEMAKTAPRRTRIEAVDPIKLPPRINEMPPAEAAQLFTGVGEYYMDRDNFIKAVEFFGAATDLDPSNTVAKAGYSEALALYGNELVAADDNKNATKQFLEALKFNDRNAPAYFGLAEIASEQGNKTETVANYEKALTIDPGLSEIYAPLGILYIEQGEVAKAEDILNKAIGLAQNDAQLQFFTGLVRHAQNRNKEALAAFERSTVLDPSYPEAFYFAGESLVRVDRDSDAIGKYKTAVELRENYFDAWFAMGNSQYVLARYTDAIESFKRASRIRLDNAETYLNLGDAHRQNGDFNDAEASYQIAVSLIERTSDHNRDELADIYSKIGFVIAKQCELNMRRFVACRWNSTVNALEKAASLSSDAVDDANLGWAYTNAGRDHLFHGRNAEAREKLLMAKAYLEKAVNSNVRLSEGPLMNLGMVYTDLGDWQGAIDTLKKVVQREPKWTFALNELGIAYLNNGNFKEAISELQKAVKSDDKFAAAHFNLAQAHFKNGNLGEARKSYLKLRSLGRNDLTVKLELMTNGAIRG